MITHPPSDTNRGDLSISLVAAIVVLQAVGATFFIADAAIGLLNSTPHSVRHGDPAEVKPVLIRMTLAALHS